MKSYSGLTVDVPGKTFSNASLRYTSERGFSGCQGFVQPAVLTLDGKDLLVQVKRFYKETSDDRGEPFSQNPEEEVEQSYQALCKLKQFGFKVPEFFARTKLGNEPALILDDLRKGETIEVYDEKALHNDRQSVNVINGRETKSDANKSVKGLKNYSDIKLGFLHTSMLAAAYGISFGYAGGTEHMITRNPSTNEGDIFVVDVGQFEHMKSKYRNAVNLEEILAVPEGEIISTCSELLHRQNIKADAEKMYVQFSCREAQRKRFMELAYKSAVGMSLWEMIGGWYRDAEWAKRKFVKNNFPEIFLQIKLHTEHCCENYKYITGKPLFKTTQQDHDGFVSRQNWQARALGIDFAYLAVLDAHMQHMLKLREAIDAGKQLPRANPVVFGNDRFPVLGFFDSYNETKGPTTVVEVQGWDRTTLSVELPWEDAYHVEASAGTSFVPPFFPQQIKGITVEEEPLPDFDPSKVIVYDHFGVIDYVYENNRHLLTIYGFRSGHSRDKKELKRFIREVRKMSANKNRAAPVSESVKITT